MRMYVRQVSYLLNLCVVIKPISVLLYRSAYLPKHEEEAGSKNCKNEANYRCPNPKRGEDPNPRPVDNVS